MGKFGVYEALDILKKYYITDSKQMVNRWIRENKIMATRTENRKAGWEIDGESLYDYLETLRPWLRDIFLENEHLKKELKELKAVSGNVQPEIENQQISIEDLIQSNDEEN